MPRVFARLSTEMGRGPEGGETVAEIVREAQDISAEWHPDFLKTCVDITSVKPQPEEGWVYNANGKFSAPPEVKPTPAQQMAAVLGEGVRVTSTKTPELDAVYHATGEVWERMREDTPYVVAFGAFPGGDQEVDWPVRDGEVVFRDPAQFAAVSRAISDWRAGWQRHADGKRDEPPASEVAIA